MRGGLSRGGFTLLEVMVATLIAGVSFGAICALMGQVVRTAGITGGYSKAVLLAESKLDELSLKGMEDGTAKGTFKDQPGYSWELTKENAEEDGLQKISLKVIFTAPGGKREVVLHTLHAERALPKSDKRDDE